MKQTPDLDCAQARMQPGEITLPGFLGDDDRKLADIIAHDAGDLAAHRVAAPAIADRLAELTAEGRHLMEEEVEVENRYRVTVRDDRGVLPSPFGDGRFEKGDTHLRDPRTDTDFRWNGLTLHMIRNHGFFGGRGSPYRIDPARAIAVLGIPPDAAEGD